MAPDLKKVKTKIADFGSGFQISSGGQGTNLNNSMHEDSLSFPYMDQRFDIKLENKYVKKFQLNRVKNNGEVKDNLIEVVGMQMR